MIKSEKSPNKSSDPDMENEWAFVDSDGEQWGLRRSTRPKRTNLVLSSDSILSSDLELDDSSRKSNAKTSNRSASTKLKLKLKLKPLTKPHSKSRSKKSADTRAPASTAASYSGLRFSSRGVSIPNYALLEPSSSDEELKEEQSPDISDEELYHRRKPAARPRAKPALKSKTTHRSIVTSDEEESLDDEESRSSESSDEAEDHLFKSKKSKTTPQQESQYLIPLPSSFEPELEDFLIIEAVLDVRYRSMTTTNSTDDDSIVWSYSPNLDASPLPTLAYMKSPAVEYFIKWKGFSYIHAQWSNYEQVKEAVGLGGTLKKLEQYVLHCLGELEDEEENAEDREERLVARELQRNLTLDFCKIERILDLQPYIANEKIALVKWTNLPYADCTWERVSLLEGVPQCGLAAKLEEHDWRQWKESRFPSAESTLHRSTKKASSSASGSSHHHAPFLAMETQPSWLGSDTLRLRDYQLSGLNWLAYSYTRNTSTILADEMGLGKTIQSTSFLSWLYHEQSNYGPFLLVVPLSTIHAWMKELQRWAPELIPVLYVGDSRSRKIIQHYEIYREGSGKRGVSDLKFNVLLTTFELILKDASWLASISWSVLIVDEAHRLKNASSQLHQILKNSFETDYRLLITGTPLQNSLKELYALLSFLAPDKFSSDWESFEAEFLGDDLEPHHSASTRPEPAKAAEGQIGKLHEILKPHLLRRLKSDVEKSLPSKRERILRVDLSPLQKLIYKWILTRNYKELNRTYTADSTASSSSVSLLNMIGELKKAACHPYMFHNGQTELARKLDPEGLIYHSGKMILLDSLLQKLLPAGHRVLIFSQSVALLDLLSEYCGLRRFSFLRLDGSVPSDQRKRDIERFNATASPIQIFLLSTRAGGLGINLETADTVILFDSDWNPQNDLQAMARAHRIGQKKSVNIYRLVSKHTVEEEILERAKKKMVLDHLVIQRMDTSGRTVLLKTPKSMFESETEAGSGSAPTTLASTAKDLQSILMFGARALFQEEETATKASQSASNVQGSDRILLHQLLLPSSISVKSMSQTEEDPSNPATSVEDLTPALKAILTRPSFSFDEHLESVLSRAALPEEEQDDHQEPSADAAAKEGGDTNFLDSFKVADLSGALLWSAIIPESERIAFENTEKEVRERQEALNLVTSFQKRQVMKDSALVRILQSKHASDDTEPSSPLKKKKKTKKALAHELNDFEKLIMAELGHDSIEPDHIRAVLDKLNKFGTRKTEEEKMSHDQAHPREPSSSPVNDKEDQSKQWKQQKQLEKTLLVCCEKYLNMQQQQQPQPPHHMEGAEAEKSTANQHRTMVHLFGAHFSPSLLLKKVRQLDILHHAFELAQQSAHFASVAECLPHLISGRLRLQPALGRLKNPVGWRVPWQPIKDDTVLLVGIWKHGLNEWYKIRDDPELDMSKKLFFLDAVKKKTKKKSETGPRSETEQGSEGGNGGASESENEGQDKALAAAPTKEHIKRRADYLLEQLESAWQQRTEPSALKKQAMSPTSSTEPPKKRKSMQQASLDPPLKPSSKKPESKPEPASKLYSSADYLKSSELSKVFGKLFKPIRKEILSLDSELSAHVPERERKEKTSAVLLKVGSYIASLIKFRTGFETRATESEHDAIAKEIFQQLKSHDLHFLSAVTAELEESLWEFMVLCWPTESNAKELKSAYHKIVAESEPKKAPTSVSEKSEFGLPIKKRMSMALSSSSST